MRLIAIASIAALFFGAFVAFAADAGGAAAPTIAAPTTQPAGPIPAERVQCADNGVDDFPSADARIIAAHEGKPLETFKRNGIPAARDLWGRTEVLCVHPRAQNAPAHVDFSALTKDAAGELTLHFHAFPGGDCEVVIRRDGQEFKKILVSGNDWIDAALSFHHERIDAEVRATGWFNEHAFIAVDLKAPTPVPAHAHGERAIPATLPASAPRRGTIIPTVENITKASNLVRLAAPPAGATEELGK